MERNNIYQYSLARVYKAELMNRKNLEYHEPHEDNNKNFHQKLQNP